MEPFTMSVEGKSMRMNFASSLPHIDKAAEVTAEFLQHHTCPLDAFGVQLVLREGLLNAVQHGNHHNPLARVDCMLALEERCLQITIADEGEGFPAHKYKPDAVEVDLPHGRGLLMMYVYDFDVAFNAKGNVLFLTKEFANH